MNDSQEYEMNKLVAFDLPETIHENIQHRSKTNQGVRPSKIRTNDRINSFRHKNNLSVLVQQNPGVNQTARMRETTNREFKPLNSILVFDTATINKRDITKRQEAA